MRRVVGLVVGLCSVWPRTDAMQCALTQAPAPGERSNEGLRWHQIRVRLIVTMFPNRFQKIARNFML